MRERVVEVVNELGLHARAAARLVRTANEFQSNVVLRAHGREAKATSILGVLLLGAGRGAKLTVRCCGEDEQAAMTALCDLIQGSLRRGRMNRPHGAGAAEETLQGVAAAPGVAIGPAVCSSRSRCPDTPRADSQP